MEEGPWKTLGFNITIVPHPSATGNNNNTTSNNITEDDENQNYCGVVMKVKLPTGII